MKQRLTIKVYCSSCGVKRWTSSPKRPYLCMPCKREAGLAAEKGYTSLTVAPRQELTWGRCKGHQSTYDQELANGLCRCCRFYNMPDVDEELSDRARCGPGGQFDWVRRRR